MSKLELLESIPLHAERLFACNSMQVDDLTTFNSETVKLIYELQSEGKVVIIGEPRRENSTGFSLVSLIRIRRIG